MGPGNARPGEVHRPLRDLVCDDIRDKIVRGVLEPGTHLVEDRLAAELGVSRNPVREALRMLQVEGFIEMVPRKGAEVAQPSNTDVQELFEVRSALEALAARLAARRSTAADHLDLYQLLAAEREALEKGNVAERTSANSAFHERVSVAAGNGFVADLVLRMRARTQWFFSQTAAHVGHGYSFEEHIALADAIAAGDEDGASKLAARHVESAAAEYWSSRQAEESKVLTSEPSR